MVSNLHNSLTTDLLIHDKFRWSKTPLGRLKARAVELETEARAEKEISEAKKKAAAGKS